MQLAIDPAEVSAANLDGDEMSIYHQRLAVIGARSWMPPMHYAKRRHFPRVSCLIQDDMRLHEAISELRRVSGEEHYEIVYDRSTTLDASLPGHHVYLVQPGGIPSEDVLVLQWSLKLRMGEEWSPRNAAWPWEFDLVGWFRANDKARMGGDPAQVDEALSRAETEANERAVEEANKAYEPMNREFAKDAATFIGKNRNGVGGRMCRRLRNARPQIAQK